ncbi:hypothetical protein V496_05214 [Pseudogymnoascus sp. VKM F-4515 (FW-2607)]|nr:hypothetical protein V496_05214 [Pseudogymnoascus sp. VKM F-4515 (FW-2607)]KFY98201.1 hypothetical protein V498_01607 [Pseudogymnoascus sp. VKM F-4517 (FW-2822)]
MPEAEMPTDDIRQTLRLLEERIATLEQQVQKQKRLKVSKGKNSKHAREEADQSDAETPTKLIKQEADHESNDGKDDIKKKDTYRKSNVRVLRLTGAGKQNMSVMDRMGMTVEDLIEELDSNKPGAKDFIMKNITAHKAATEAGIWRPNQCFQLHHHCAGATINGQFPRHQISPTCGYCISRKGGPCRITEDGNDCERCSLHTQLCLTYEDMSDIYKRMESACGIMEETLEKWPLIRAWLTSQTAPKVKYGLELVEAHINDRTETVSHRLPGVEPCRLFTYTAASRKKQKPMPRGWITIHCNDAVLHRRNIPFINLLRFRHLLEAVTRNDSALVNDIVEGRGEVSHRCKPTEGRYCWQWEHTVYETADKNAIRDHYCFTARRLCACQPPCLYNGEGGRFVQNVNPTLPQYGGWKPAEGRDMKTRYTTAELGAVSNEGDLTIVSVGPAGVIELD